MKRAVIFAHYEKDGLIPDYVLYYLKEFRTVTDDLIFVSCNKINEREKLEGIATYIIDEPHNEYDFGSYKRGFLYLENRLNEFDEIVFANDSCYGPFYQMKDIFKEMDSKECDFWGITKNLYDTENNVLNHPHIQSYFVVIKKQIFTQEFFKKFINSIKEEKSKIDIVTKYEIGLSNLLLEPGFHLATLVNCYENNNNITLFKWRELIEKYNMPFVKKSLFDLKNLTCNTIEDYPKVIKNYPLELIKIPREINKSFLGKKIKIGVFRILNSLPWEKRQKTVKILSKSFNSIFKLIKD